MFLRSKTADSMTVIPALPSKSPILSLGFPAERAADGHFPIIPKLIPPMFDEGKKITLLLKFL